MSASNDQNARPGGAARRRGRLAVVLVLLAALAGGGYLLAEGRYGSVVTSGDAHVHGAVVRLGTRFDARIAALHVDLGDEVARGQVLVELEDAHLRARVAAGRARAGEIGAERQAAEIALELDARRADERRDQAALEIRALEAELAAARASREQAENRLERTRSLYERGTASARQFDLAREEFLTARADVERLAAERKAARTALAIAEIEIERRRVRQVELAVLTQREERVRRDVEVLETDLAATRLSAAHAGLVTEVAAREGASVRPNDTILSYWIRERSWIAAWVSENDATRIRPGMAVEIRFDALPRDTPFGGRVAQVLIAADARERTLPGRPISPLLPDRSRFAVKIVPDGTAWPESARPGSAARVRIETGNR